MSLEKQLEDQRVQIRLAAAEAQCKAHKRAADEWELKYANLLAYMRFERVIIAGACIFLGGMLSLGLCLIAFA